jgi:hypothetical protein
MKRLKKPKKKKEIFLNVDTRKFGSSILFEFLNTLLRCNYVATQRNRINKLNFFTIPYRQHCSLTTATLLSTVKCNGRFSLNC